MTIMPRIRASLAPLALLAACETQRDRSIVGSLAASHASGFSPWSEPVNLGPTINTSFNDQQAALSQDGLTLYFASARPPGDVGRLDIYVSRRACVGSPTECPWESPVSVAPVNTACTATITLCNDAGPALSRDGHWLFLLSNRPGGAGSSDIWAAWRENVHDDAAWQTPVNLGPGINTTGFQGGAAYFENDETGVPQLYFNHSPQPAPGGGDIYVSGQAADGSWGPASPVAELNTTATDQRPSVSHSGLNIYFFSNRPGSVPDATGTPTVDIWAATRESVLEPWSSPTNLGAPINTAVAEQHPFIFSHGSVEELYFARNVATPPAVDLALFVITRRRGGN